MTSARRPQKSEKYNTNSNLGKNVLSLEVNALLKSKASDFSAAERSNSCATGSIYSGVKFIDYISRMNESEPYSWLERLAYRKFWSKTLAW